MAVIIGDVLVLLVTWSKTVQLYHESRRLGIRAPLATLLFRDGQSMRLLVPPPSLIGSLFRDNLLPVSPPSLFAESS